MRSRDKRAQRKAKETARKGTSQGRTSSQVKASHQDWTRKCDCGNTPVIPETDMCEVCTFGTAEGIGESVFFFDPRD